MKRFWTAFPSRRHLQHSKITPSFFYTLLFGAAQCCAALMGGSMEKRGSIALWVQFPLRPNTLSSEDFMKAKLPIVTKDEIVDGKRVFEYAEKEVEINTSLTCQIRWEASFPEQAKKESIVDYAKRMEGLNAENPAVIISRLKAVFCFIETGCSFIEFIKLFDMTQPVYLKKLEEAIKEVFQIVFDSAAEKN